MKFDPILELVFDRIYDFISAKWILIIPKTFKDIPLLFEIQSDIDEFTPNFNNNPDDYANIENKTNIANWKPEFFKLVNFHMWILDESGEIEVRKEYWMAVVKPSKVISDYLVEYMKEREGLFDPRHGDFNVNLARKLINKDRSLFLSGESPFFSSTNFTNGNRGRMMNFANWVGQNYLINKQAKNVI